MSIAYHYLSLLMFIPGPGSGPYMKVATPPLAPDQWTRIWPVREPLEFPPVTTVDARDLEAAVTDFSKWLLIRRAMRFIRPSPVAPLLNQRN